MKKVLVMIAAVLFLATATYALAVGPRAGKGFGAGPKGQKIVSTMDLSKEQMDKIWQIREKFNNDTSSLRYEHFQKRNELRTLYADPEAKDAAILEKEKELNALRQNMHDKMVRFKLEQRKVYTPEQLQKIAESGYGHGFGKRFGHLGAGPCGRL